MTLAARAPRTQPYHHSHNNSNRYRPATGRSNRSGSQLPGEPVMMTPSDSAFSSRRSSASVAVSYSDDFVTGSSFLGCGGSGSRASNISSASSSTRARHSPSLSRRRSSLGGAVGTAAVAATGTTGSSGIFSNCSRSYVSQFESTGSSSMTGLSLTKSRLAVISRNFIYPEDCLKAALRRTPPAAFALSDLYLEPVARPCTSLAVAVPTRTSYIHSPDPTHRRNISMPQSHQQYTHSQQRSLSRRRSSSRLTNNNNFTSMERIYSGNNNIRQTPPSSRLRATHASPGVTSPTFTNRAPSTDELLLMPIPSTLEEDRTYIIGEESEEEGLPSTRSDRHISPKENSPKHQQAVSHSSTINDNKSLVGDNNLSTNKGSTPPGELRREGHIFIPTMAAPSASSLSSVSTALELESGASNLSTTTNTQLHQAPQENNRSPLAEDMSFTDLVRGVAIPYITVSRSSTPSGHVLDVRTMTEVVSHVRSAGRKQQFQSSTPGGGTDRGAAIASGKGPGGGTGGSGGGSSSRSSRVAVAAGSSHLSPGGGRASTN